MTDTIEVPSTIELPNALMAVLEEAADLREQKKDIEERLVVLAAEADQMWPEEATKKAAQFDWRGNRLSVAVSRRKSKRYDAYALQQANDVIYQEVRKDDIDGAKFDRLVTAGTIPLDLAKKVVSVKEGDPYITVKPLTPEEETTA
jgi:hypothetical protein